jgi:phosphoribosyl-AMP cyclohydrolase
VLLRVRQEGVACHTGRRSCFYRTARDGGLAERLPVTVPPERLYGGGRF